MNDKPRPIDANVLRELVEDMYISRLAYDDDTFGLKIILDSIDNAPTIKAEPVRHGKWEINSDGYYPYCSHCKQEPQGLVMTKYCPNCGAKMDLKED